MNKSIAAALFLAMLTMPAGAQAPRPASDPTLLHLTERAERKIPRDLLRATLAAEATNADPGKVQAEINRRMAAALARIRRARSVIAETAGYSVYREPDEKGARKAPRWHGSQSVALTGRNFEAVLQLIGALQQQGLVIQALAPALSRHARQVAEDSLTDEALARLQQRAERIAAALGTRIARFRSINVGNATSSPPPLRPLAMTVRSAAAMPPPVAAPGNATVSVSITAEIALAAR